MDRSTSEIARKLGILEHGIFWIERIITITLTCLWIHFYFYFFFYSRESIIFDHVASVSADTFLFTNSFFLICLFIRTSLDLDPTHHQDPQDEDIKKLPSIEHYAFCIERSGMVVLRILYLPLGVTQVQFSHIIKASCIALFLVANILYLKSFILAFLDEKEDSYKKCIGGTKEIDEYVRDRGHQVDEKDDTSPLMPNFCCRTYVEEGRTGSRGYNGISCVLPILDELGTEVQEYGNSFEELDTETEDNDGCSRISDIEGLGIETHDYDDNLELAENIPDLEEIEETKEDVEAFSGMSFEMLNMQERIQELRKNEKTHQKSVNVETLNMQVNEMNIEIQVMEKKLANIKEKHQKKLERIENKWNRKLMKFVEKYTEERKMWEEQKFDLAAKLSAAQSTAEFYYFQAQDREVNCRKLEEEVNYLIMKLWAANGSCETYRSLLLDNLLSSLHIYYVVFL